MALTKLTDVIVPEVFTEALYNEMLERSEALYQSGIAEVSDTLQEFMTQAGKEINLPFVNQLVNEEAAGVTDDAAQVYTPKKLTMGKNIARKMNLAQAWSHSRLASKLSGIDPLGNVVRFAADYWEKRILARMLASVDGIVADDVANDSGSMLRDISTTGTVTDANLWSATSAIEALLTMGDQMGELSAILTHSVVAARMMELDLIDTERDSTGKAVSTYFGMPVFTSDMCYAAGTPTKYRTVVCGKGAFSLGLNAPEDATEIDRNPLQGNAGGVDTLISRIDAVVHPNGFQFVSTGLAADTATIAELQGGAQWDKQYERKRIKIAVLDSNG